MKTDIKADLFARYPEAKRQQFRTWLTTPHGKQVYKLFRQFAEKWKAAGNSRCSSSLIVNRLRWEVGIVGKDQGFKVSNDHAPMMARQLVTDHPDYDGFFTFHDHPDTESGR